MSGWRCRSASRTGTRTKRNARSVITDSGAGSDAFPLGESIIKEALKKALNLMVEKVYNEAKNMRPIPTWRPIDSPKQSVRDDQR